MSAHIILLGTTHPVQCGVGNTSTQVAAIRTYIHKLCIDNRIKFIAEEMSVDGLASHKKKNTIASQIAKDLDIQHMYIDLTRAERAILGLDEFSLTNDAIHLSTATTRNKFLDRLTQKLLEPVRERCWLARIYKQNVWPVLFICGADHVENMRRLIRSTKQSVTIAHSDYMP